jgi:hypothetical protein
MKSAAGRPTTEYALSMLVAHAGDRISVDDGGVMRDGIVFDVPSRAKVVVAVFDTRRGPVLRTVHPNGLTERTEDGTRDPALRLLIRRTPPPVRGGDTGGAGAGRRRAGHTRGTSHRTTGK